MLLLSASFRANARESYLFDGNVAFVTGCLLVHALVVVALAEDSKADGDAVVVSTDDSTDDEDVVIAPKGDSDDCENVPDDAELEIGDTVRYPPDTVESEVAMSLHGSPCLQHI